DNIMKNIYFFADYQADGSFQFIKLPWDLNMTWGNSWVDDYNCNFNLFQEKNFESIGGWTPDMEALYERNPEEIGALLYERWQHLREAIITKEALYAKVDAEYAYLYSSGAYVRNQQKWPPKGEYWQDEYIYEYIDKRIDFLDSYIGQMR
ncbi:MAG: CotH kinase family protein, partial [Lachnospiraceae bacterium]|nr:CotH kinase family protein [Lachnospiraceae bacterium]